MKYDGYIIKMVPADLGEEDPKLNIIYEVWKDGKFINSFLALSMAKDYIDSGCNNAYL